MKRELETKWLLRLWTGLLLLLMATAIRAELISEEDHQTFEQKFAKACVEEEKTKLKGSGVYLAEVESVCQCIAKEESKRLTVAEIREYLIDGKTPISLIMKENAAAYVCIEGKGKAP